MVAEVTPLIIGITVFVSSLISLRIGISVAIIEILAGVLIGNIGVKTQDWMLYLSGFGGIVLTFLAGAEINAVLMKQRFKESILIGFFSFAAPFAGGFLFARYILVWNVIPSLLAATALSETSIAVVYSVLMETGLSDTVTGKMLFSCTFITNMFTALSLSFLFTKPTLYTAAFYAVSFVVIMLVNRYSGYFIRHPKIFNKVIEPEIKFIFFILFIFIYFAKIGVGQAVLPAFIFGMFMSKHFHSYRKTKVIKNRLKTIAYAVITPLFFIVGGMKIELPVIISSIGIFLGFFVVKQVSKFIGVYFFAKKYIPNGSMYTTLLMSTGLTFGLIALVFGLQSGIIDSSKYSLLTGVLILSCVIPTFIAQKWFMPIEEEDII
ncbi:MAG: potassium transporter [Elusimicrobia bacterium RIFOXYC2_FULL_34_12]|nr:MAG: potassium transporter [Elusimicrobia bacterium RIFOXYC2_FULL_34_12]